jgi:NADH:ubiquinone oxidoreductase subunit D
MPDQFATPEPDEAVKLAMRRIAESAAPGGRSDMEGLAVNEVVVNMGPQHPSTHGVVRLVVTLDGELVKDVIPVIGYLHRCKEKLAEKRTYYQYIPIVDRTEYVASMNCEWAYVMTVEKLMGIKPTRRAEFIRVIVGELSRKASNLLAVGTFTADLSPLGTAMVFYMFRDRETILDLLEEVSGARMMFNYLRFGGVRYDLPAGWVEKCRDFMKRMPRLIDEYESLVEDNAVVLQRPDFYVFGSAARVEDAPADAAQRGGDRAGARLGRNRRAPPLRQRRQRR